MPDEVKPSLPVNLIGTLDYQKFTYLWLNALNEKSGNNDLCSYFKKDCKLITAILFSLDAIKYLISSEGVVAIKAKFCIDNRKEKEPPTFNIVLFGVDKNGKTTSAYYLGTPTSNQYSDWTDGLHFPQSTIPSVLASSWIKNWLNNKDYKVNISFSTIYGYLEGYTFDMMDFLDAAFDESIKADTLCIHLAMHEFYQPDVTDEKLKTSTFGLVLQGIIENPTDKVTPLENLYYDISAPSPPY